MPEGETLVFRKPSPLCCFLWVRSNFLGLKQHNPRCRNVVALQKQGDNLNEDNREFIAGLQVHRRGMKER